MLKLRIIKQTESWIVVDKPPAFHTHPPEDKQIRIAPRWNALGILERQLSSKAFPMHRLDRAASGLLLYSLRREYNNALQRQFAQGEINKIYYVLVRGRFVGSSTIVSPILSESGKPLPAVTEASACYTFSLPLPHPDGGERSFTLIQVEPRTGRFHQIRRHLASAGFPLIGDSRHGDRKLNREFATLTGCRTLFLRCMFLEFQCPESGEIISVTNRWSRDWHRLFEMAGTCPFTAPPSKEKSPL